MIIAIHSKKGSFSERWISYCKRNNIEYKIVNAYSTDIIDQLKGCDVFMWHHHHANIKDVLIAKNILFALEHAGIKIFPNFKTGWHFDDKVAQKYLLEAVGAPLVASFVFYDENEALKWAEDTVYPKIWKLKGGAGSANVKLIENKKEAKKLIYKAFGKGFSEYDGWSVLKERWKKYRKGQDTFLGVIKAVARLFISTPFAKTMGKERGYIYFQEFIANNDFDIRVIVIGDKAFAVKRMVRDNDFRASGSGNAKYDKNEIDLRCVEIAFDINKKINSQSIGYDFVFDEKNNPLIVEIGYGFAISFYDPCPGYWDSSLQWHEGKFIPQDWMVEGVLMQIRTR